METCLICKTPMVIDGHCPRCYNDADWWFAVVLRGDQLDVRCHSCGSEFHVARDIKALSYYDEILAFDWSACPSCQMRAAKQVHVADGRKSQAKGRAFQKEIVRRLIAVGIPAKHGWFQSKLHAKAQRPLVPDVIVPGCWIECSTEANSDRKKLKQALNDIANKPTLLAIAIVRPKGEHVIRVIMTARGFIRLCYHYAWPTQRIEPVTFDFDLLVKLLPSYLNPAMPESGAFEGGE